MYADKHRRARQQKVTVGDKVLLWQKKTTTKQPYDPDPYEVTQVVGTQGRGEGGRGSGISRGGRL